MCRLSLCIVSPFLALIPVALALRAYEIPALDSAAQSVSGVALVTGASGGFGREIAAGLALAGFDVIIVCRLGHEVQCANITKATWHQRGVDERRRYHLMSVDLASTRSMRNLVVNVEAGFTGRLRVLVNCASLGGLSVYAEQTEPAVTEDGLETIFQVNVYAYYFLATRLMPALRSAKGGVFSIVNVASANAGDVDLDDAQFLRRVLRLGDGRPYRQSKGLERALTAELARRLRPETASGIARGYVNAVSPGANATGVYGDDTSMITYICNQGYCNDLRTGAARSVWLARYAPAAKLSGSFWDMPFVPAVARPLLAFWLGRLPGELPGGSTQSLRTPCQFADAQLGASLWGYLQGIDAVLQHDA